MSLREEIGNITTGWRDVLLDILEKHPDIEYKYTAEIETFGESLPIYPERHNIFRCFNYFEPEETRVVILGQDPYHGPGQAIGLSFGVNENVKMPPSLRNIYKKLGENSKTSTTLEHWAKQGILMLNAALTVRHKTPASHMKMWLPFTKDIIRYVSELNIIFVVWGAFAHGLVQDVGENAVLLVSSHPSPLSYSRKYRNYPAFKETDPFKRINEILDIDIEW
tara:strand:+ start:2145 stop:2810 length:666 start_codon:yes stop_codon:yes gene_type:complete